MRIAIYCEVSGCDSYISIPWLVIIIIILWRLRDRFFLLASLALAISGRAKIVEWKLDTALMMHVQEIKQCSFI